MQKLTEARLKAIKPGKKPFKVSDGGGLFLFVKEVGKYWRWKYRFDGKEKSLSFGKYPEISLAKARELHQEGRALLKEGQNPSDKRRIEKLTRKISNKSDFRSIAMEWFDQKMTDKSVDHQKRQMAILEKDLFPTLGNVSVRKITALELTVILHKTEKRSIDMAHRVRQVARSVLGYAVATGRADSNPARELDVLKPLKQKHLAAIVDPLELGLLMDAAEDYQGTKIVRAALKLSIHLFQRPGEIRQMEWKEVNFEKKIWAIPGRKMKTGRDHLVPLSFQAIKILTELRLLTGNDRYAFPGGRRNNKPLSENTVRKALRTLGYGNDQVTPHGFRATARTLIDEELGYPMHIIEAQLSHAVKDPNGRAYNRTSHLAERSEMMQEWSNYLEKLTQPEKSSRGGPRSGAGRKTEIDQNKKLALLNEIRLLRKKDPTVSDSSAIKLLQEKKLVRPQSCNRYLTPKHLDRQIKEAFEVGGSGGIVDLAPRLSETNP